MQRLLIVIGTLVAVAGGEATPVRVHMEPPVKPVTTAASHTPTAKARDLYKVRCVTCHGERGLGDGPAAAGMMKKPRRFSDAIWQDSVDDAHITKAILEGGFAVKKSTVMPAHPDLKADVDGLVAVVRSFRSKTGTRGFVARRPDGTLVDQGTVDADAQGRGDVVLRLPDGPTQIEGRVSGRADAVCAVVVDKVATTRELACGPTAFP